MRGVMTFEMPDKLIETFAQWIRDFDTAHADCQFNIFAETKYNRETLKKIFESIKPGFPFIGEFKLKDEE